MAYFSNGTEGMIYEGAVCSRCVHQDGPTIEQPGDRVGDNEPDDGCPVWLLHFLYNYDAVGKEPDETAAATLEALIPRAGLYNGLCRMFHAKTDDDAEAVRAWAERVEGAAQADD